MRSLFPGFYERTDEEFSELWQEAIFAFDTNMLLNIYRYQEETRERYFEILEHLKDRIWIPHQVAYEYQDDRMTVIEQQLKTYGEVAKVFKEILSDLDALGHLKEKHSFIKIDELTEDAKKALRVAKNKLSEDQAKNKKEFEKLRTSDVRREKFTQLFQGKIGEAYSKEKLLDLYKQADIRFALQIPPGWKDKCKKSYAKYGDVILWFQLLDYASSYKKNIIFVTDDRKSDWYMSREESKGRAKPRPELVQEMLVEAGVLIHIYQGDEFFDQASKFLNLKSIPNVIEDVRAITEQNTVGSDQVRLRTRKPRTFNEFFEDARQVKPAVQEWIESTYPDAEIIKGSRGLNFIMVTSDGIRTGIKAITTGIHLPQFIIKHVVEQFGLLNILHEEEKIDNLIIFLVCHEVLDALEAADMIEKNVVIPENVSILTGHTHSNNCFFLAATIPQE